MVYIDDYNAKYRGMIMCHMIADSTEELLQMVDKIGVQRKWIECAGTWKEHFDICLEKKEKAISLGAKAITKKELSAMRSQRRNATIKSLNLVN